MTPVIDRRGSTSARRASAPRRRPSPRRRPVTRGVRRKASRSGQVPIGAGLVLACALFMVTFVSLSVLGNSMLEEVRRKRIATVEQTVSLRAEVSRLRRMLNGASSLDAMDRWAAAQGLVPAHGEPIRPLVARREEAAPAPSVEPARESAVTASVADDVSASVTYARSGGQ